MPPVEPESIVKITGYIARFRFKSDKSAWAVCAFRVLESSEACSREVAVVGDLKPFAEDDTLDCLGVWEEGKYGRQFKATTIFRSTPKTISQWVNYLRRNIKGV